MNQRVQHLDAVRASSRVCRLAPCVTEGQSAEREAAHLVGALRENTAEDWFPVRKTSLCDIIRPLLRIDRIRGARIGCLRI